MAIKSKISLMGILPLLALLYFAFHEISEGINVKSGLKEAYTGVLHIEKVSNVIHEMQKERSLSVDFLSYGRNGDRLKAQTVETDRRIKELEILLKESPLVKEHPAHRVMPIFSELNRTRREISAFLFVDVEAWGYYTETISALIETQTEIVKMTKIPEIKNELIAYQYLLYSKEFLGQMEAALNAVFRLKRIDSYKMGRLVSIKGSYDINTYRFLNDAPEDVKRLYIDRFQGEAVRATKDMIDSVFFVRFWEEIQLDPDVWLESATASMNILQEIEDYYIGIIKQNTLLKLNEMTLYLNGKTAFMIAFLTAIIVPTLYIGTNISKAFANLKSSICITTEKKDFTREVSVNSKDEIGDISRAFNSLLDVINQLIMEKERLAETDPLTKIYNRLKFDNIFISEILRAQRYETALSLIMFDIDNFKQINDNYGHHVGDEVLIETTKVVSGNIRETDIFARLGGEEFAILTPNTDMEYARKLSERLRAAIESAICKEMLTVTCSFGVAEFREGDTADTLSKRADKALYEAKKSGKNRVCVG
jgi:diguanylate cyclase (GGDEF)-like protein